MNKAVLIVVPAYNEEKNIENTIKDIKENTAYDYVIINDCSTDSTKQICEKNKFNLITLPINSGLSNVIRLGMKYAYEEGYQIVLQFDGDGQHEAKYINILVDEIKNNNCDIAIGSRFLEEKKKKNIRMIGSKLISLAIKLTTGITIKDPTSGMRAYGKKAIYEFNKNLHLAPEPETLVYMIKNNITIKEIQVKMKERQYGASYLTSLKSIEYMLDTLFSIFFIRNRRSKKEK